MTDFTLPNQIAALRHVVFNAVQSWNAANPHPLRSRQERASVDVTHTFADAIGIPSYSITIVCALSGVAQLTFHGPDLGSLVERAQLVLEQRISAELQRRANKGETDGKYGIAV